MFDCANVEMRELLPELAAGTLDASTRARVEEHLLGCAECASELDTLRLVRGAFAAAPAIDARRIVAALPKPIAASVAAPRAVPVRRWVDWRIAAALTMITVGGLSVAVAGRFRDGPMVTPRDSIPSVIAPITPVQPNTRVTTETPKHSDSGNSTVTPGSAAPAGTKAQLSFNGGVSDLDEASIQALLGALDEIDRSPVAPSAEPDHSPLLPVIKEGDR
jgi:anti-sigma factor RsiW